MQVSRRERVLYCRHPPSLTHTHTCSLFLSVSLSVSLSLSLALSAGLAAKRLKELDERCDNRQVYPGKPIFLSLDGNESYYTIRS